MTKRGSTFKDLKESKELSILYRASKEGHREERGGMRNLIREAADEELAWTIEELEGLYDSPEDPS
jgi:hypothetical protein